MNNYGGSKIIEMLDKPIVARAPFTFRYSSSKLIEPESLSTHIYEVQMIGLMLIDYINFLTNGEEHIDREEFLMKALLHDADEAVLGDVPRPLKYASPSIKEEIDKVAHKVASDMFKDTFKYPEGIHYYYQHAKSGKTGMLVKLADMLCVIKKLRLEVEYFNNYTLLNVIHNSMIYVDDLDVNSTYDNFDCEVTKQFVKRIFNELRSYLNVMDKKYIRGYDHE